MKTKEEIIEKITKNAIQICGLQKIAIEHKDMVTVTDNNKVILQSLESILNMIKL